MKTINIHGKKYVEVKERIKHFRENYKGYALTSEVLELTDTRCVIISKVLDEKERVLATGIAYEILGSTNVNKTSFVENCETSANGRALANLGIMIDDSIASADEVQMAISQKDVIKKEETKKPEKLTDAKFQAMIVAIGQGKGDKVKDRMKNYKTTKAQDKKLLRLINEQAINEATNK